MRPDDFNDPIQRRRAKRAAQQRRNLLIAGGVVIGLLLLGCCGSAGLLLVGKGRLPAAIAGPSAGREGNDWTHRELFEYLKQRSIVNEMRPYGGSTALFMTKDTDYIHASFQLDAKG